MRVPCWSNLDVVKGQGWQVSRGIHRPYISVGREALEKAAAAFSGGPPISTEISGEDALVDLADISVFRIDHLRAACFRDLAKQHVSFGGRNLPVILHPIDHLLEGNAHGVFQRTGAT